MGKVVRMVAQEEDSSNSQVPFGGWFTHAQSSCSAGHPKACSISSVHEFPAADLAERSDRGMRPENVGGHPLADALVATNWHTERLKHVFSRAQVASSIPRHQASEPVPSYATL